MLIWLTTTASWAFFLNTLKSNSIPIMNINNIKPIWLRNWRFINEAGGNKNFENSGKSNPNNDGPSTMPAIISPITVGCPIFIISQPNNRAIRIIVRTWKIKIANGCWKLCKKFSIPVPRESMIELSGSAKGESIVSLSVSKEWPSCRVSQSKKLNIPIIAM